MYLTIICAAVFISSISPILLLFVIFFVVAVAYVFTTEREKQEEEFFKELNNKYGTKYRKGTFKTLDGEEETKYYEPF